MSINVTGTNDTSNTNALGVTSLSITSGELFSGNEDTNIAILGTELATKNGLTVGSTFTAYDTTITVIGIYDSGNTFTNSSIIMPIKTLQTLSDQAGLVSSVIVESDSMDNIATVQSDLETNLGDAVDVVSSQDTVSETIEPLENIKTITFYSLIGSLVAGSIIIFLTMLMIVRERRREIGALKAIGASNTTVILQFITESLTLTFLASIVGIIGGFAFSNPVLNALVSSSTTSSVTQPGGSGGMPGGGGELMAKAVGSAQGMQNTLNDLQTIIGFDVIIYGILAAFVIAVIGSSIPAFFISKIRPAEVMRSE
jgi:putative ABC transport system permease protein